MKKNIVLILALVGCSGVASALDFGLGVTLESGSGGKSNMILVPIMLADRFFIEPYYRESYQKVKSVGIANGTMKLKRSELGVGAFYRSQVKDSLNFYLGVRAGDISQEFSDKSTIFYEEVRDGYSISPTLGLQYQVVPKFWVSGEADWGFSKVDGDDVVLGGESHSSDESRSTSTRVVLRYLF
jgi:hypothetical protein